MQSRHSQNAVLQLIFKALGHLEHLKKSLHLYKPVKYSTVKAALCNYWLMLSAA